MRREVKRYVIRSRWCNHAIFVFLIWSFIYAYATLFDNRFFILMPSLSLILGMLLLETVYVCVYEEDKP
jgi:hypothetical protein